MNSLAPDRPARTRHPLHLRGVDDYADGEIPVNRLSHAVLFSRDPVQNCGKARFCLPPNEKRNPH